jgi:GAF domain-containing protein
VNPAIAVNPVLHALAEAAVAATGASDGWLLAVEDDGLRVVAVAGATTAAGLFATTIPPGSGSAGFVAASGQPLAVAPRGDDPRFSEGTAQLLGRRPTSVLSVPASTDDGVVGVLELVDKVGGGAFSFDDVELATLLADIAGVALVHTEAAGAATVPRPAELGGELERLATSDPTRYAGVATAVAALLSRG